MPEFKKPIAKNTPINKRKIITPDAIIQAPSFFCFTACQTLYPLSKQIIAIKTEMYIDLKSVKKQNNSSIINKSNRLIQILKYILYLYLNKVYIIANKEIKRTDN